MFQQWGDIEESELAGHYQYNLDFEKKTELMMLRSVGVPAHILNGDDSMGSTDSVNLLTTLSFGRLNAKVIEDVFDAEVISREYDGIAAYVFCDVLKEISPRGDGEFSFGDFPHFCFVCNDSEKLVSRMNGLGYRFVEKQDWHGNWQVTIYVKDRGPYADVSWFGSLYYARAVAAVIARSYEKVNRKVKA